MKAVTIHKYGSADELIYEETENPGLLPDDVLIKVYATSVNPVDWKVRSGNYPGADQRAWPVILGWDVSGTIEHLGKEVTGFQIGDEVYARPNTKRQGTYAEYVAVNYKEIALKPKSIDHIHAAAVPLAGMTAWQGLFDHGKLQAGQKVLIHAAAGGVGIYAVQLAKWKGAYVIGTASESNIDFLKDLGADEVIDYNNEDFEERLGNIDLVLDLIGGDVQLKSLEVLKPGGIFVSTLAIKDEAAIAAKGLTGGRFMTQSNPEDLRKMAQLIDEGKLKPIIYDIVDLKDAAEAQRTIEEGHVRGKIVLKVVDDN
ncbi:MAG: NADP-dependent oxidoreductase [Pedobacter sp.]|uniref:NADP-dependent oxidoreductase n=1 Tax=Pedobacter sp. TaxID=1411316 RepID=UPI003393B6D4